MRIILFLFPLIFSFILVQGQYDVMRFGAKADGTTLSTQAIQAAIDAAYKNRGGVVEIPAGTYRVGTLLLKDNVNLHLHPGAILSGSPDYRDYTEVNQKFESRTRQLYAKYFMIFAEGAKNISITGAGTIHGNGAVHFQSTRPQNLRPFMIRLVNCENVIIRDVQLLEAANWTLHLLGCRDVNIDGVTIENTGEGNRDGLDIDASRRVTVANARFSTTDDAIVLKTSTDVDCRDITITNCVLRTHASAIKTGTESNGDFRNITVSNCVIKDIPVHAGIELITVDGGAMQNVLLENIAMENVATPIFIKLGIRARPYKEGQYVSRIGDVQDIFLNNITVTNAKLPSSIMGLHSKSISNVTVSNYTVRYNATQEAVAYDGVPFEEFSYPMALMYKKLPAYALYCRNVKQLHLHNLMMFSTKDEKRPAMTFDRVEDLELTAVRSAVGNPAVPMAHFRNIESGYITGCRSLTASERLFEVEAQTCRDLKFAGNLVHPGQVEVAEVNVIPDPRIFEDFDTPTRYTIEEGTAVRGLSAHDLAEGPLHVNLKMLKNGPPQLCLLMLNDGADPEKVRVRYQGVTQEFAISWREWGWAPITLLGVFKDGQKIDFEISGEKDSRLKISKVYVRYQDIVKTD